MDDVLTLDHRSVTILDEDSRFLLDASGVHREGVLENGDETSSRIALARVCSTTAGSTRNLSSKGLERALSPF